VSQREEKLRRPKLNNGVQQALRILVTARDAMSTARTRSVNSLTPDQRLTDVEVHRGHTSLEGNSPARRGTNLAG
jgi:hypothetical protein